ncbi:hypothetical protein [Polaribacter porphyrae]|uniref:Lipoprotein n=1 Tax=Polaribacter porphyrae TaxID=1137780 RepID=A0A2S7WMV0_9FLAO|nr:hypothetical protein [Polaribacter porphyrae]PQJ78913.1 hypothetical protein BTO18_06835 [Polaribacter porphyrae]
MKKILLVFVLAVSTVLISCKESTKKEVNKEVSEISNNAKDGINDLGNNIKEGYNDVKENMKSAFDDIKIPELNDEKAEAHLKNYSSYIKTQLDKGIKNIKNSEFTKEVEKFAKESEAFMKNLSAEAKASFKATIDKIDAKADEIEKDLEN